MQGLSRTRLLFFLGITAVATASLVVACTDDPTSSPSTSDGGNPQRKDGSGGGGPEGDEDSGEDPTKEAGSEDPQQVDGPGEAGAECAFNRDCKLALRCECDEDTGCSCQPGARGTGKNGVDGCDSGNQCASSLCVEGPGDAGESFCSDECKDDKDCTGKLPRCIPVFGIPEPICAREAPQ